MRTTVSLAAKRFGYTALAAVILPLVSPAEAQEIDRAPIPAPTCEGLLVDSVSIEADRPVFRGLLGWWRKVARSAGLHHRTTEPGLIRRFVSLDPGRRCTEFRRSESERILRAQPYIAGASVVTRQVGNRVRVDVSTVDEVPVVAAGRFRGARPQALNLGTMNFLGLGMHVEGRWEEGNGLRDGYGTRIAHPQLFGKPYSIELETMQRPLGEYLIASVRHPYYTDLQKIAWHTGYSVSKDFARLRRTDDSQLLQPIDRAMWNVGGVVRFGPPRRLGLIGAMVLGERVVTRHEFFLIDSASGRAVPTSDTVGVKRYTPYDAMSVAGVLGLRALTYSRMRGLDALAADQDVAVGTQIGTVLGFRPAADIPLREAFAAADAYVGARGGRSLFGARVEAESRLDLQNAEWQHFVASGRAAWYIQPTSRWTSELSIEGGGAWRTIIPFQLELGDRRGGVRGYARTYEAGAHRAVVRLEERLDLARFRLTRAAFGAAGFVEAGRVWSGDVPFGVSTPVRASFGVAALAAVPARSRRTLRAELAVPLTRTHGAQAEFRFTIREPTRGFWVDPDRIRWARLSSVPEAIFSWP
jgi:hypothetical protein